MTTSGKSAFINDVLMELTQIKDPVIRELNAGKLSELTQISTNSIFEALQTLLKRKQNNVLGKLDQNTKLVQQNEKKPLLEEDLIRLCFANEPEIRKFLFDYINHNWLGYDLIGSIYDKIYREQNKISLSYHTAQILHFHPYNE